MTRERHEQPVQWPKLKPAPAVVALYTSDARAIAEIIVGNTLEWASARLQCELDEVIQSLNNGDLTVQRELKLGLAHFVAEYLGFLDRDIKAVYIANSADPDRDRTRDTAPPLMIQLVVYAEPKTAALASLIGALNRALTAVLQASVASVGHDRFLDVQLVNAADREKLARYAALLTPPIQYGMRIWERKPSAPGPRARVALSGDGKPLTVKSGRTEQVMPDPALQKG